MAKIASFGRPCIELRSRRHGRFMLLAVFRSGAQGLEWLRAGRQVAE